MTLTPTLRLTEPTPLGDDGVWATYLNNDLVYIDQAINGYMTQSIAGLTTYTLVADGSGSDQARYALYTFTGALSADCTVTIPANSKIGFVRNMTTGGRNVILSTGSGSTVTIPNNGYFYHLATPGASIGDFSLGLTGNLLVAGTLTAAGLTLSGPISVTNVTASGTLAVAGATSLAAMTATTGTFSSTLIAADGTTGEQVVNNSQFERSIGTSGYQVFPGGLMMQWGATAIPTNPTAVTFPTAFSALYNVQVTQVTNVGPVISITSQTTSGFNLQSTFTGGGIAAYWMALGTR